jgi:type I site-specific restriction endonuclease
VVKLNLPSCELKLRHNGQKLEVFDIIRKKFIQLTDEEWVRQNFVHYLINHLKYPRALISLESGLKYNQLSKRTDIVVYGRDGNPFMVVECKSPIIKLSQAVFHQASCYNSILKANFLVTTNGLVHYCCRIDHEEKTSVFQIELPAFSEA